MRKNIVVDGVTLEPSDPNIQATIEIVSPSSTKVLCEGKGVYHDGDRVKVTDITYPVALAVSKDSGPYVVGFSSTCKKVFADGKLVVLEGDSTAEITATPKIPRNPPQVPEDVPVPVTFKIVAKGANQTKVLAQ